MFLVCWQVDDVPRKEKELFGVVDGDNFFCCFLSRVCVSCRCVCIYERRFFFSDDQVGLTAKSNSRTLIPIARFEIKRPLSGNWINSWILFSRKIHCSHSHSLTRLLKTPAKTAIRKKYLNRNLFYLFLCLTFCSCSTTEMTYDDWVFHIWKNCNCRFVFFLYSLYSLSTSLYKSGKIRTHWHVFQPSEYVCYEHIKKLVHCSTQINILGLRRSKNVS